MAKVPVEHAHGELQHGSFSTPSADMSSRDSCHMPGAADIKRLIKAKAAQDQRLKAVRARVQLLHAQEHQAWKDVKLLQRRGNEQAQFAQWQREIRKEEQLQFRRDVEEHHEALKERARHIRASLQHTQAPRLEKFRENKMVAQQVREDSRRLLSALKEVREQSHQSKMMQVEVRRQQCKQQQLRKQVEATRRDQLRQEWNALRYAELQEEMQQAQQDLAAMEQQEIAALSRLQRSQSVRESVASHRTSEVAPRRPASMAEMSTAASMRLEATASDSEMKVASHEQFQPQGQEMQEVEHQDSQDQDLNFNDEEIPRAPVVEDFMPPDRVELPEDPLSAEQADSPVEDPGLAARPKREGRRPKQPRGYGFSPKTRVVSAGPAKSSREAMPEAEA